MTKSVFRGMLIFALLAGGLSGPARSFGQEVATVEQLKTDAFRALRDGKFEQTNELLGRAASMSQDPVVAKMAEWIGSFEKQRENFTAERKKQYEKTVGEVQLLLKNGKDAFAMDSAARAYLLADDKETFRKLGWVDELIKQSTAMADEFEAAEQWLKALRLYSDLGAIEPANPAWKDKLKLATRRLRLVALYTPDALKTIQQSETKERDEVDALLHPATQPATAKAAKDEDTDGFRIDWRETLRGIRADMLWDALVDSRTNYYRQVEFRDLMLGGLKGLEAMATTKGLETTFAGLGDEQKRKQFLDVLHEAVEAAKNSDANDQNLMSMKLRELQDANGATIDLPEEVFVSEFADGAFAELDPFSSMIWPSDVEEFNKTTQGEFGGVGIQIKSDDDGSLTVVSPIENSPAFRSGIKAYDAITHIDGKNAKGISINQAVKTIAGPPGTTVTLTVRSPSGVTRDYTIVRSMIKVASIKGWLHRPGGGWDYLLDPDNKIAYVRLTNFTKTTGDELDKAIDELKDIGAKGMILDLRYNPGGLLSAATDVADKFMHDGTIVSTKPDRITPNQPWEAKASPDGNEYSMPTIVLVNQYSASASEIVSGALKDSHRAMVVGERTFGKGSVQMLFPIGPESRPRSAYLKLTTSHYYLPSGRCIHREENSTDWGVDPDLKIEMTPEQMRVAIDARQNLDVLRDAEVPAPAQGQQEKLNDKAREVQEAVAKATKDPLSSDPQLSAALLLLRMQLAGAQL